MKNHSQQPESQSAPIIAGFDSLAYWRNRHEQFLLNPQGVGNAVFDVAENERIYEAVEGYVANVVLQLNRPAPLRVLDLGCGIGMLASSFLRTGCDYTGVDISEKAVEIARAKYPKGHFQVANIADLPLNGPYDIIIERTVFIHLVEDEYWKSVIKEVSRLLSEDGLFVLIDHLPASPADAPVGAAHVKFRLHAQYVEALTSVGLQFDPVLRDRVAQRMALSPHTHFVSRLRGI
jgi:2-polyprenyl-3-methyl-5-hydroxy-6-metoxy-1,4-benzoquinol methylase